MVTPSQAAPATAAACTEVRQHAFAACDGELTAAEVEVVDAHLAACAPCRARFTADATLHHAVRAATRLDAAPASLRERVERLLHAHTTENAPA